MEEDLECPICFDIFGINQSHIKAPKVLKCGDTICKECLEKIIENLFEDFFLCPLCKEKIKKEENIDEYTTNKKVIKIINSRFNIPNKEIEKQVKNKPIEYSIIALGNSEVGKTSIFMRLLKDTFSKTMISTVGVEFFIYYLQYNNIRYKIKLNDPSGQEQYKSVAKNFLRKNDGVLFVYDVTNQASFDDLKSWLHFYKEVNEKVVGLLIGNKCDLESKVNEEEVKNFSQEHGLKYLETSAKSDKNLRKAISCLLGQIIKSKENIETKAIKENKITEINSTLEKLIESEETDEFTEGYLSLNSEDLFTVKTQKSKKKKCGKCGC